MSGLKKIFRIAAVLSGVILLGIQLVPVQRDNPPVKQELAWRSDGTQQLFERACADCHSNRTTWPAYAYVAPVSWFVAGHVDEARTKMNVSEWTLSPARSSRQLTKMAKEIEDGSMPPASYVLMHPEARLSDSEKITFANGLRALAAP